MSLGRPVVPKTAREGFPAASKPEGHQCDGDRHDICNEMAGLGQKRKAVAQNSADHIRTQENATDEQHPQQ